jgi:hypothetical protein
VRHSSAGYLYGKIYSNGSNTEKFLRWYQKIKNHKDGSTAIACAFADNVKTLKEILSLLESPTFGLQEIKSEVQSIENQMESQTAQSMPFLMVC